ncbi:MAG: prolyl oligopeptidase family serine peptidase [Muribaculaceae bacterium]|nr:prolyl oligopeptidase family serine peptidase [Muribaculaceae bacterium]
MKRKNILSRSLLAGIGVASAIFAANAEDFKVTSFESFGPYPVHSPLMVDSLDVNKKPFSDKLLDNAPKVLPLKSLKKASAKPVADGENAVRILSFDFKNAMFSKPSVEVEGIKNYTLYLDGRKVTGDELTLSPGSHSIALRYVAKEAVNPDSLSVTLQSPNNAGLTLSTNGKRSYTLEDVLHGNRIYSSQISPDGKYIITFYAVTRRGGQGGKYTYKVTSVADGKTVAERQQRISWMPKGSRYYYERQGIEGTDIVAVDAATGAEEVIISNMPEGVTITFTPDEKSAILTSYQEGKKEDPGVYQILEPDDRQPGWRDRSALSILDLETGVISPLTFGNRNVFLNDISSDSKKLLLSTNQSRLEKRPTTVYTLYTLDLETMKTDTLVDRDGFIEGGFFSPDGKTVAITGSPEALGGIGKNLPEGRTPSMVDRQLFLMDLATKDVTPVTKDFNPCVQSVKWSVADGQIYFTAEDRDCINLFRLNPATGKITQVLVPVELLESFSVPDAGRYMVAYGESASAPQSLYLVDTKTMKSTLLDIPKGEQLADVELGKCEAWDFVNSRGDTICGRFYLPADFDPSKKYPLIVNYYGGCSPTSRHFESRYPHHAYASQGYVVYVVEPSGATGFGQEFSSRHVATAGQGVAEDIIEGTKKFCEEHPYVDDKKIGCIGASYGGFMTQYLQTVTDIFAAAISHAGISDHTSYWGEGYWGYSYSETSMGDHYPWTDPDLYVKQSPLYRADKVHTPILFLHGDKDNNVPVGESIQMFTALKLLDRPTAFVAVADQDHHITDYDKRRKWQDTIYAWFARYLKDDPIWWNSMYEE